MSSAAVFRRHCSIPCLPHNGVLSNHKPKSSHDKPHAEYAEEPSIYFAWTYSESDRYRKENCDCVKREKEFARGRSNWQIEFCVDIISTQASKGLMIALNTYFVKFIYSYMCVNIIRAYEDKVNIFPQKTTSTTTIWVNLSKRYFIQKLLIYGILHIFSAPLPLFIEWKKSAVQNHFYATLATRE